MSELRISTQDLSRLMDEAMQLATAYWATVEERRAFPETSARTTQALFSRPWREEGIGRAVLDDFAAIADHSRPSGGKFFAYVFG
ncbi:MAG: pyridoxal-dependent decarboxylase, partial [Mesorhizobium sp.]